MTLALELAGIRDEYARRALEQIAQQFPVAATGGGGGGAPSGPAGGVLGGTYPNPGFAADMATQAELDAHAADTTAIHGIADTSLIVVTSDPRLSDVRTPTTHHATHEPGGSDAMTVDAAAATGSLRTLGATATAAAAGNRGMPTGGTLGQALAKNSATDYDASWTTIGGGGPPSGAAGGDLTGSYPNPTLAANAVATADVTNRAITANKLEFGYKFGYVTAAGGIGNAGSGGWTVTHPSTGNYTVTFTSAFITTVPVVIVTPGTTAASAGVRLVSVALGSFLALTFITNTAAAANNDFSFIAIGQTV